MTTTTTETFEVPVTFTATLDRSLLPEHMVDLVQNADDAGLLGVVVREAVLHTVRDDMLAAANNGARGYLILTAD